MDANQYAPRPPGTSRALDAYLDRVLSRKGAQATSSFRGLALSSRFQPIFSFAEQRAVGYEGLLVASNYEGECVPPNRVFEQAADEAEVVYLDWLARTLHMRNFKALGAQGCRLYLNVAPLAAVEDPQFGCIIASLIRSCGMEPGEIVMEILEHGIAAEDRLVEAVALYRSFGCGIALDDFGIGASQMSRVWKLRPDVVKIDREAVSAAAKDPHALRVLKSMVNMIHDCGARAVLEGVESHAEALVALETNADDVQGYFFARPGAVAPREELVRGVFEGVMPAGSVALNHGESHAQVTPQRAEVLQAAAMALETGASFATAAELLLAMAGVQCGYLMSPDCKVLGSSQGARVHGGRRIQRLVRDAVAQPGVVRLTPAYSEPGSKAERVSLAYGFICKDEVVVLCADMGAADGRSAVASAVASSRRL